MQLSGFFLISWIFIPVTHSQTESLFDLDTNIFDDPPIDSSVPTNGLDFEESDPLHQTEESDLTWFLAENSDCGADVNNLQSFQKFRRQVYCPTPLTKPPVGQTDQPDLSHSDEEKFDFNSFLNNRPLPGLFEEDHPLCPPHIFGLSDTPVCESPTAGATVVVPEPGQNYATLYNVFPCMAARLSELNSAWFRCNVLMVKKKSRDPKFYALIKPTSGVAEKLFPRYIACPVTQFESFRSTLAEFLHIW